MNDERRCVHGGAVSFHVILSASEESCPCSSNASLSILFILSKKWSVFSFGDRSETDLLRRANAARDESMKYAV
jgi:hypothetical protein